MSTPTPTLDQGDEGNRSKDETAQQRGSLAGFER